MDSKFRLMELLMRNALQEIENIIMFLDKHVYDRLVSIERKMLLFEKAQN